MKAHLPALATAFFFMLSCADGRPDSAGLSQWEDIAAAIDRINAGSAETVVLATRATISVTGPLPPVSGIVSIEGNGATLEPADTFRQPMLRVLEDARLEVRDLTVSGFVRELQDSNAGLFGLIDNSGHALFERVTMAANPRCEDCGRGFPLVLNRGQMRMNNVTVYDNDTRVNAAVHNDGSLQIIHSTLAENRSIFVYCSLGPCAQLARSSSLASTQTSRTELANVLIQDESHLAHLPVSCWLEGEVVDIGGNRFADPVCANVLSTVPYDSVALGRLGDHGGLVPTVGLEPESVAIDAGLDDYCSANDARLAHRPVSGSILNEPRCDAGAFEFAGGFGNPDLAANGLNGLWFDREHDGHYVHVMRVSPDRVHLSWSAFDPGARQMWIYAVAGHEGGTTLSAPAYINLDGQRLPGGAPDGSRVEPWGEITIEFETCTRGTFRYRANDPGIGEGEFQLDRLAFIEGGGCTGD